MNLINGNSNEELCYINDNSVDLVIIDPPYKIVGGGAAAVASGLNTENIIHRLARTKF